MTGDSVFRLHSVSVVVTAEFHNPSILSRDFLASQGIVPADWEATQSIMTPPVSLIRYRNGIEWTVDQSRLVVMETCDGDFLKRYQAHKLVNAYLKKLPNVPYRSLGLNCNVSMAVNDPGRWLTERFLKPEILRHGEPRLLSMMPKFVVDAGDAVCHISLNAAHELPGREQESGVIGDCNVHHPALLQVDRLQQAIRRWPERQVLVLDSLEKLLK